MTVGTCNGSNAALRSGARTLALLSDPLNRQILRELAVEPRQQTDLRRSVGTPAHTTLRTHVGELGELGILKRRRRNRFPGALEFELSERGEDLLSVTAALRRWLDQAPRSGMPLGEDRAKIAIKALTAAWSTGMLRALAAGPRSLTELDRVINALSYPALERRLATMRLAGQVEARSANGKGTPYAVTEWTRRGMASLLAAARWERRHLPNATARFGRIDAEAVFLLAVPLLRAPSGVSGSCRMAMEVANDSRSSLAGVVVEVAGGRPSSCTTRLRGNPEAWVSGSTSAWFDALVEADLSLLESGGDGCLARTLVDALHAALKGTQRLAPQPHRIAT